MMLEGLHPNNPTHVARIVTGEASARRIADLLGESFDPAKTAVAAFEREDGTAKPDWLVEVYFASPPDEGRRQRWLGLHATVRECCVMSALGLGGGGRR